METEISKTKVVLFIVFVLSILIMIFAYFHLQNVYIVNLNKNNMKIEYQETNYVNNETTSVVDIPNARSILNGSPFYFGENIMLSSGTIVNVEEKGYIDDITAGEIKVDFLGQEYVDRTKYIALYVTVYNNQNKSINLKQEDFEIGYLSKDNIFQKAYFKNDSLKKLKGIFSLDTIHPYTKREGYVFIPIEDVKMDNFYFKFEIENVPLIYRK